MTRYRAPAAVVMNAWSVFRLAKLQALVNATIAELNELDPRQVLGRELSTVEADFPRDPVGEALSACSEELRRESGMAASCEETVVHTADQTAAWAATFDEALDQYRRAATQRLEASIEVESRLSH